MRALLLVAMLVAAFPSVAKDASPNGIYRPTLATNARSYLRKLQLGKITAEEVVQYLGTPDKTFQMSGSDYLTYNISKQSQGTIEYTFQLKDGVVVNATYLNSGNFFGVTQRESALELQKTD